jgi:hypothetical protein
MSIKDKDEMDNNVWCRSYDRLFVLPCRSISNRSRSNGVLGASVIDSDGGSFILKFACSAFYEGRLKSRYEGPLFFRPPHRP